MGRVHPLSRTSAAPWHADIACLLADRNVSAPMTGIAEAALHLARASRSELWLIDPASAAFVRAAGAFADPEADGADTEVFARHAVSAGQARRGHLAPPPEELDGGRSADVLALPLVDVGAPLGAIVLVAPPGRLDAAVEQRLNVFATTAAAAVESTLRRTDASADAVDAVLDIAQAAASRDAVEIARRATRDVVRLLHADMGAAWLLVPGPDRFVPIAGYRIPGALREAIVSLAGEVMIGPDHPVVGEIRRTRGPVFWAGAESRRASEHPLVARIPCRAGLVVPLFGGDEVRGAITVGWTSDHVPPCDDDRRAAEAIAHHAAVALQNLRLTEAEREARARLEASESNYSRLFNNVTDIVYVHDLGGRLLEVNDAGVRASGYTREELLGKNLAEVMAPEELRRHADYVRRLVAGERLDYFTAQFVRKDGSRGELEASGRVVDLGGQRIAIQGIARDVTLRRKLEARQVALVEITNELAALDDFDRFFSLVAQRVSDLIGVDAALVSIVDGDDLVVRGASGITNGDGPGARTPIADTRFARVLRDRRPHATADARSDPHWRDSRLVRALGYAAILEVPILLRDQVIGVLGALHRSSRPFGEDEVSLLVSLAGHVAVAIDRTSLLAELNARLQETQTLLAVSHAVSSTLDPTETIRRIARETARALGAQMVGAYLADAEARELRPIAGYRVPKELLQDFIAYAIPLKGHRILEEAWVSRQPVFSSDVATDLRINREVLARFPHRSALFMPMLVKGEPIGGLFAIWFTERHEFSRKEIRVIEGISRQTAIYIENSRLFAEATQRRREAEEMARLAGALTESLEVGAVGRRIVESARALLGGMLATLRRLNADGSLTLLASAGVPEASTMLMPVVPPGAGIAGRAVETGAASRTADVLQETDIGLPEEIRGRIRESGTRAILAVPLRVKRQTIGVLALGDRVGRGFTDAEVALLQAFADQAAIALDNSRLYDELRAALRRLEESQQRVVRSERLRALGEMAAGVAHDFNNVLSIIVGRAEILLSETDNPETQRQIGQVVNVALDAARTVRRIQEFTRMRRARPFQPIDLNQIVDEVAAVTRSRWKDEAMMKGVRYEVTVDAAEIPAVAGDPSELREALTNILFNALDAMPDGGSVTFTTAVDGDRVVCTIRDTGPGMPDEVRQRVFDPFFTTKGERGTGLGLSVVYGIVTRHGGDVDVQSEPGQGSLFTIRLPIGDRAGDPETPVVTATSPGQARILVVDDEAEVRDVLTKFLSRDGHHVETAADGGAALQRLDQQAFDLVITDLGMPGVSGWEVARHVKASKADTAVVMVTGWGDRFDLAEAEQRGVDYVVAKPFKRDQITAVVASALTARVRRAR